MLVACSPPPHALVELLEATNHAARLNHNTQEKMVKVFKVPLAPLVVPHVPSEIRVRKSQSWPLASHGSLEIMS